MTNIAVGSTISEEFHKLAKENGIGWSEALEEGIKLILSERSIYPYDNKLQVYKRMRKYQAELEQAYIKIEAMEEKIRQRDYDRVPGGSE